MIIKLIKNYWLKKRTKKAEKSKKQLEEFLDTSAKLQRWNEIAEDIRMRDYIKRMKHILYEEDCVSYEQEETKH